MSSGPEGGGTVDGAEQRRQDWDAYADVRERIAQGFNEFDEDCFAQFLQLPDVDLEHPDLIYQFIDRRLGSFSSLPRAVDAYLKHVGWTQAAPRFLQTSARPDGSLEWNWDELMRDFHRACHVCKHEGRFHVFTK